MAQPETLGAAIERVEQIHRALEFWRDYLLSLIAEGMVAYEIERLFEGTYMDGIDVESFLVADTRPKRFQWAVDQNCFPGRDEWA